MFRFFIIFSLVVFPGVLSAQEPQSLETTPPGSVESQLKGVAADAFKTIEPWRKKQAAYFTELRDRKRQELGVENTKDIYDALTPSVPEAPAVPGSQQEEQDLADLSGQYAGVDLLGYGILLYATAFAAIFSSMVLFYVTAVLLALLVLRFILRLFS